MDGFSIRKVTLDDLEQVTAIELENARVHGSKPWPLKIFEEELKQESGRFYVLTDDETDERIAGYVLFRVYSDYSEILNVSIAPQFKRRGNGALLVRTAINEAMRHDVKRMFLEVRKGNEAAIQLYHSLNFEITRVRKNYYKLGPNLFEDAYEMELVLSSN